MLVTDAPLLYRQLKRLAKRAIVGLARVGGKSYNGSGYIVLAFSTAYRIPHYGREKMEVDVLRDSLLDPFFLAGAEATEEAIIGSLFISETMIGRDNRQVDAVPREYVIEFLRSRNALSSRS